MKTRQNPLNTESAAHYARVELSTHDEVIVLARPLPCEASDLMEWQSMSFMGGKIDIEAAEKTAEEDDCGAADWRGRAVMQKYFSGIQGYFISQLWAHPTIELESAKGLDFPTRIERGRAVVAELYHAGWSLEEIQAIYQVCVNLCTVRSFADRWDAEKIAKLVNFGEPAKAEQIEPSSGQALNISEIPTHSNDSINTP